MTLSDRLDGAFRVIKVRPRTVLGVAAVILVPVSMLGAFAGRHASLDDPASEIVPIVLNSLAPFFLGGALAHLVTGWYADRQPDARAALRASFGRWLPLLGAYLLLLPVKAASLVACGIPAVFVIPLLSMTAPAIVVEGLGPFAAARRSWRLGARRLGATIGTVLAASVAILMLSLLLSLFVAALATALASPWNWILAGALRGGVALVFTTALVSVSILLYLDLRIRTEGLDLELAATDAFAEVG
jgi:hypothetical protein